MMDSRAEGEAGGGGVYDRYYRLGFWYETRCFAGYNSLPPNSPNSDFNWSLWMSDFMVTRHELTLWK